MTAPRVPSGAASTWGARPPRTRGPAPSFTLEQIAAAAISVADHGGLEAVTMESVARVLGCTKMALYRYVPGKADLVALMFDAATGQPPTPSQFPWPEALRTWATALLDRYLAHSWAVDVPLGAAVLTRNRARWLESALAAMTDLPLPLPDKLNLVLLLNGHVLFSAKLARDARAAADGSPDLDLTAALAEAGLPRVAEALRAGELTDGTGGADAAFVRGLDLVLAGVAATVSATRGAS